MPVVLATDHEHGLENYADFYTVNSAGVTQIMGVANDIIRYMAYGPLSIANPEQITDDPNTYKMVGDIRGLPTALVYSTKVVRPLTPVYELMKDDGVTDERLRAAVNYLFEELTFRPASETESDEYLTIVKQSIEKLGKEDGAVLGLSSIFLDRDALFRPELVASGQPDQHGRVMLGDWELGLAVNHALRYIKPDEQLRKSIVEGHMRTKADVKREVERMLADDSIRKPRVLQFFRDYLDYDLGGYICKDTASLARTGVGGGNGHYRAMFDATASTDRLVELILKEDKNVLKQLLTTQKVVATKNDNRYFGKQRTPEEIKAAAAAKKKADQEQAKNNAVQVEMMENEVATLEVKVKANPRDRDAKKSLDGKKKALAATKRRIANARKRRKPPFNPGVMTANLTGPKIFVRVSRRSFGNGSMKPDRILATAPEGQRLGILTHPSWLV